MAYHIRTEAFEGPFDLLLHLISKRRVDIYQIPIAEISEEYLSEMDRMADLDLEVASEFILVAATLLQIKAASLLPRDVSGVIEPSVYEQQQELIAHLLEYRKFKNAALELAGRIDVEANYYVRQAALESRFENLMPDFLVGADVDQLARILRRLTAYQALRLIDSSHIAKIRMSTEAKVEELLGGLPMGVSVGFRELAVGAVDREELVVTFLAILEMFKRGLVDLSQAIVFGDITVTRIARDA